jgi:hypothetical protein
MPRRLIPILSLMAAWFCLSQSEAIAFVPCPKPTLEEALRMADLDV